jgi:hypothetical protein
MSPHPHNAIIVGLFKMQNFSSLSATVTENGQKQIRDNRFTSVCARTAKGNIVLIVSGRPSVPKETVQKHIFNPILEELIKFPITIIYCKSLQWIGYGYQMARQILGKYFYSGESRSENSREVMFHSSMKKDSGKVSYTISHFLNFILFFQHPCLT